MRFRLVPVLGVFAILFASCGDSVTGKIEPVRDPPPFTYPTAPDRYEVDDVIADAGTIAVSEVQWRTLYPVGDEDWVRIELAGGMVYEFTTSHLSVNGDTVLYLYDVDGETLLAENDDYIGCDSSFRYTPPADGAYYLRVISYGNQGLASYRLEAYPFIDGDGDGFSSFHDCDDASADIEPWGYDIWVDGIDQNCNGMDELSPNEIDPFEDDGTAETATPLVEPMGMQYERTLRAEFFPGAMHTLHGSSDEDWFTFAIPPRSTVVVETNNWAYWVQFEVVGEGLRTMPGVYGDYYAFVANDGDTPVQAHARVYSFGNAYPRASYLIFAVPQGYDRDMDGFGTMGGWGEYDCDDTDPAINGFAVDIEGDGIDQNCDGVDGVKPFRSGRTALGKGAVEKKRR